MITLKDRIGYDAGTTRLEEALATAAEHGFHYLDFNGDQGPNRLTEWDDDRVAAVIGTCREANVTLTLHTASSINIAEFSPHGLTRRWTAIWRAILTWRSGWDAWAW